MRAKRNLPTNARNTARARLDAARAEALRAEALRESFRLGGAMQDLRRAADDVQVAMIELDRAVWKTGPKV
jgi:hypothetical protein